jgi:hypothetical protein
VAKVVIPSDILVKPNTRRNSTMDTITVTRKKVSMITELRGATER